MNTDYIKLTDLWSDGRYTELGNIMQEEQWSAGEVAKFCAYFAKYMGVNQLNILYKFMLRFVLFMIGTIIIFLGLYLESI